MIYTFNRSVIFSISICIPTLLLLLGGCAGPRIAEDKLTATEKLPHPLVESSFVVNTEINPQINNYERLDDSLKQSLAIALGQANIFGQNQSTPIQINANIEIASQAAMSFGNFNGKLQVTYIVMDYNRKELLKKTIYTEAGSDEWSFIGAKRHSRARALNIAKNVLEFTDHLKSYFAEQK